MENKIYGYVRVSSIDQNEDRQLMALNKVNVPVKNIYPDMVMPHTAHKAWWKCTKGHSWQAAIGSRHSNGCPYCSRRLPVSGENDLATLSPEIAAEWDYEKNGKLRPDELAIAFGELLMPAIRTIVGWIQKFVDWLNSMDEGTRKMIVTIALVAAAIGPILIIVGKVISAVGTIMTLVPELAGVINAAKGVFAAFNAVCAANPYGYQVKLVSDTSYGSLWEVSFTLKEF